MFEENRNSKGRVYTFNDDNGYKLYILCCEQIVYMQFYIPQDNHFSNYKKKWKKFIMDVII